MEAVKVRIQTQPGFATTLRQGFPKIMADEGLTGFVYFWLTSQAVGPYNLGLG